MENFPSIFPNYNTSSADHPPHLSLNNMNYSIDDDRSNYIAFRGDDINHDHHHGINNNGYDLGLVAKDGLANIVNHQSSSSTSTSPKADHHHHQDDHLQVSPNSSEMMSSGGVKMGKMMKKDKKMMKKPRYAFQTRSQVDILDDGYRWRKYGQKAVKNNNFPRSYYRCTYQGCNVKKQVQRLSKDEGVVVTTYEGMHSHPIEKSTDNFEHILTQMKIYSSS